MSSLSFIVRAGSVNFTSGRVCAFYNEYSPAGRKEKFLLHGCPSV